MSYLDRRESFSPNGFSKITPTHTHISGKFVLKVEFPRAQPQKLSNHEDGKLTC